MKKFFEFFELEEFSQKQKVRCMTIGSNFDAQVNKLDEQLGHIQGGPKNVNQKPFSSTWFVHSARLLVPTGHRRFSAFYS